MTVAARHGSGDGSVDRSSSSAQQLLRRLRRVADLSQAELAARAGVAQSVVARYESGRQVPTIGALERLAAAAGFLVVWDLQRGLGGPEELSGPLGTALRQARSEVVAQLAERGLTNPRVVGDLVEAEAGMFAQVHLVVDGPPDVSTRTLQVVSGLIGVLIGGRPVVTTEARAPGFGVDASGPSLPL